MCLCSCTNLCYHGRYSQIGRDVNPLLCPQLRMIGSFKFSFHNARHFSPHLLCTLYFGLQWWGNHKILFLSLLRTHPLSVIWLPLGEFQGKPYWGPPGLIDHSNLIEVSASCCLIAHWITSSSVSAHQTSFPVMVNPGIHFILSAVASFSPVWVL